MATTSRHLVVILVSRGTLILFYPKQTFNYYVSHIFLESNWYATSHYFGILLSKSRNCISFKIHIQVAFVNFLTRFLVLLISLEILEYGHLGRIFQNGPIVYAYLYLATYSGLFRGHFLLLTHSPFTISILVSLLSFDHDALDSFDSFLRNKYLSDQGLFFTHTSF